jgi:hypothetical protein
MQNIKCLMRFQCPECDRVICCSPDELFAVCPRCVIKLEKALQQEKIDEVEDALDGKHRWPQSLILSNLRLAVALVSG